MDRVLRALIDRAEAVGREVQRADVHGIFPHGAPNPGADPSRVAELGQRVDLPTSYAEFLTYCDGWVGFDGQTDMLAIAKPIDGSATEQAWIVWRHLTRAAAGSSAFPVTVPRHRRSRVELSVVLLDITTPSQVRWVLQAGVDDFPTLDAFIETATEYHLATLAAPSGGPVAGNPELTVVEALASAGRRTRDLSAVTCCDRRRPCIRAAVADVRVRDQAGCSVGGAREQRRRPTNALRPT